MTRCVIALLALITVGFALAQPAHASNVADSSAFVAYANDARGSAGLAPYATAGDLADVALAQAQRMAARGGIYHNPNLGSDVSGWQLVGENVGVGGDPQSLHDAFMRSPGHRANIMSAELTQIGVGAVIGDDGRMYVAQVFRLPSGSSAAPAAPVAEDVPPPAPAPPAVETSAPAPAPEPVAAEPAPAPVAPAPAPEYPELQNIAAVSVIDVTPAAAVGARPSSPSGVPTVALAAALLVLGVLAAQGLFVTKNARAPRAFAPATA